MFIIFGIGTRQKNLGQQSLYCPNDQRETMHLVTQTQNWFKLFFIPIFPVNRKKTIARCNLCGLMRQQEP